MAGSFKQACPSCEAKVSVSEEEIGKKKECPGCKFRFKVEAPAKDKPAEKKAPAEQKKPSKEAAVKAKAEIQKAASAEKSSKLAPANHKNKMLLIGGTVAGVALVAIVGVASLMLMGGSEEPAKEKGSKRGNRDRGNKSAAVQPDSKEPPEKEMPKEEDKKPEPPPVTVKSDGVDPDVSNWLPNDSKAVQVLHVKPFMDSIPMRAMINTPGAFNRDDFKKSFGLALEEMDQFIIASNITMDLGKMLSNLPLGGMLAPKGWKMAILRSEKPFDKKHLEAALALTKEKPVNGLEWFKLNVPLDALSTVLFDFDPVKDKVSMYLADSRTMVLATDEKMQGYLEKDKGKPKKISAPPPPPMPVVDPNAPPGAEGATATTPGVPRPGGDGPGSPLGAPPGSPAMPPGSPPMPGAPPMPGDPNAPMPAAPPAVVTGNQYQTLPGRYSALFRKMPEKSIMIQGMDLEELNKLVPILANLMTTMKTPGGAPLSQDLIGQVRAIPRIQYGFVTMDKLDRDSQNVGVSVFSQDRKLGSEFIKLVFPLVLKIPLICKELKLDVAATTADETGLATDPNNPGAGSPTGIPGGPGGPGRINPGVGGPGEDPGNKPGAHGAIAAVARYLTELEMMGVTIEIKLTLPPALTVEMEKGMGAAMMEVRNKMEVGVIRANPHSFARGLKAYVDAKKAFPRGTAQEATSATKFGLKMTPDKRVGWLAELLPFFANGEYLPFTRIIDRSKSWSDPVNLPVARIYIPEFMHVAPTDGFPVVPSLENPGVTNFVGVSGVGRAAADYDASNKKRGVFGYERITKSDEIKDGPDKTIAVILTPQNRSQPWMAGGGATILGISEGADALEQFLILDDPKTKEKYGIAIMADGKVRRLSSKITPEIFKALCTIDGGETIDSLDSIAPVVKELAPAS